MLISQNWKGAPPNLKIRDITNTKFENAPILNLHMQEISISADPILWIKKYFILSQISNFWENISIATNLNKFISNDTHIKKIEEEESPIVILINHIKIINKGKTNKIICETLNKL